MDVSEHDIPTILVVLGATGDLIKRKIIPAIYYLHVNNRLPKYFHIIGVARRDIRTESFQAYVKSEIEAKLHNVDKRISEHVSSFFTYSQGEFEDFSTFERLKDSLERLDVAWRVCANKLFYLAVPPVHFEIIFKNMVRAGLHIPCGGQAGWARILVEKPFGYDIESAKRLFSLINKHFKEEQIYLIDHYLAKSIVQAIMHFRFSNNLLEKSWNNSSIERIDLRLLETIGVEERGAFYDRIGALRDVGQNHLLQMLAVITMDSPGDLTALSVRNQRAMIMESLKKWELKEIKQKTFRAQYNGFKSIFNISPNTKTETYFKLTTELIHPEWAGIPINIESGKCLPVAKKEVVVTFKDPKNCVGCLSGARNHNKVIFEIEPEDKISIHFWTKKLGFTQELEDRTLDFFLHKRDEKAQYAEEYAELIYNCLMGNQAMFVSEREVLAQWKFSEPIISAWQQNMVPLHNYAGNSDRIFKISACIEEKQGTRKILKELGIIGLGKMGGNMAMRMIDQGWRVVGLDRSPDATTALKKYGMIPAYSIKDLTGKLSDTKIIWLMLPAGKSIDEVLFGCNGLVKYLKAGDVIIDGGNSFYKDTLKRSNRLAKFGICFLDCGTSGGPNGARHGASLMIGGKYQNFEKVENIFHDFALPHGYQFFEGVGAGHFLKMIHNGIEYGMMQAIAEGFTLLKNARYKLDLTRVADIYNHGTVIESRLVGWLKDAFTLYGEDLKSVSGIVEHTGEGLWTVNTAKEMGVISTVIEESLSFRIQSEKNPNFTGQVISALRGQFGGHDVQKK